MSVLGRLSRILKDPPPEYAIEVSEGGLAWERGTGYPEIGCEPIEAGVVFVSPLRENVLWPNALTARARRLVSGDGSRKTRRAVLILPDYSARVSALHSIRSSSVSAGAVTSEGFSAPDGRAKRARSRPSPDGSS